MQQDEKSDGKASDPAGSGGYVLAICAALALGAAVGLSAGYLLPERNAGQNPVAMLSEQPLTTQNQSREASNRAAPRVLSPAGARQLNGADNPIYDASADHSHSANIPEEPIAAKPVEDFLDLPADLAAVPGPTIKDPFVESRDLPIEPASLPIEEPARPLISIVMDDLGLDQKATRRAIALPTAVTLSFLPYGRASQGLAEEALARGHEVMVHIPMEPEGQADPGPNALLVDHSTDQIASLLARQLDEFPGAVGFNNHMGSRFTADVKALLPVMREARARGLLFLDSRTTANTLAAKIGEAAGATTVSRDVFLDHAAGADGLLAQLDELENTARATGKAIAIAHPHALTLDVLEVWSRGLAGKGLELAPISRMAAPEAPSGKDLLAASSL